MNNLIGKCYKVEWANCISFYKVNQVDENDNCFGTILNVYKEGDSNSSNALLIEPNKHLHNFFLDNIIPASEFSEALDKAIEQLNKLKEK